MINALNWLPINNFTNLDFVEVSGDLIDNSYEVAGGIDKLIWKVDSFVDSARKLGLKAKSEIADFAGIMKKASQPGSRSLLEPFGELAEKVAKGLAS